MNLQQKIVGFHLVLSQFWSCVSFRISKDSESQRFVLKDSQQTSLALSPRDHSNVGIETVLYIAGTGVGQLELTWHLRSDQISLSTHMKRLLLKLKQIKQICKEQHLRDSCQI